MRKIEHYRGKTNREKFNKLPIFAIDEKGKPLVTEKEYSWLYDYADQLQTKMQELEEDNKNSQALSKINREEYMRIHEQNKRYREALEFYADENNYKHNSSMGHIIYSMTMYDKGKEARKALEESK